MLNVIMLSVIMLNVIMLSVIMLSVITLNVIMLNVMVHKRWRDVEIAIFRRIKKLFFVCAKLKE
jgi:hypothetical protein